MAKEVEVRLRHEVYASARLVTSDGIELQLEIGVGQGCLTIDLGQTGIPCMGDGRVIEVTVDRTESLAISE